MLSLLELISQLTVDNFNFLVLAVRQSKCKHLQGVVASRKVHIENIRNVSHVIPGESDMFHANRTFCAVPLTGAGGLLAIFKVL